MCERERARECGCVGLLNMGAPDFVRVCERERESVSVGEGGCVCVRDRGRVCVGISCR